MAPDPRRSHRHTLIGDLGLFSVSLLLALLIWVTAQDERYLTKSIRLGVRPIPPAANIDYQIGIKPNLIVSVPSTQIDEVNDLDFEVVVDLSTLDRDAGLEARREITFPLSLRQVEATPRLTIPDRDVLREEISPPQLKVTAQLIAAPFAITPNVRGEPGEGHHIEGLPEVTPYRIWLTGSRDALDAAAASGQSLSTEPIDVAGLMVGPASYSPALVVPEGLTIAGYRQTETSQLQRAPDGEAPETLVVLTVAEDTVTRSIEDTGGTLPIIRADLRVTRQRPERFTVSVEGPASLVARLQPEDIIVRSDALVDIDQPREEYQVQVRALLRTSLAEEIIQRVRILSVDPREATVTVERVEVAPPAAPIPAPDAPQTP
jgi:hypothetical protein